MSSISSSISAHSRTSLRPYKWVLWHNDSNALYSVQTSEVKMWTLFQIPISLLLFPYHFSHITFTFPISLLLFPYHFYFSHITFTFPISLLLFPYHFYLSHITFTFPISLLLFPYHFYLSHITFTFPISLFTFPISLLLFPYHFYFHRSHTFSTLFSHFSYFYTFPIPYPTPSNIFNFISWGIIKMVEFIKWKCKFWRVIIKV